MCVPGRLPVTSAQHKGNKAGFVNAPPVTADIVLTGFLSGSTDALVMGPTGFPDPADYPGFLSTVASCIWTLWASKGSRRR